MTEHMHSGHRERTKEKVLKGGLEHFADHELLEFLLFYARRQGDTNPIGHALLRRFGTLSGVLDASIAELCQVEGVGENTAMLLRTVSQFVKRHAAEQSIDQRQQFLSLQSMHAFLASQFIGESREVVYLLGMDQEMRVLCCELISHGTVDFCHINMRDIVELVLRYQATCIVVAHNHPNGIARPSGDDMKTTRTLENTLGTLQLKLFDHVIVSKRQIYSFRQHDDLLEGRTY